MLDAIPSTRLDTTEPAPFPARNGLPCCGNWGVVYTQAQGERWAEANLARAGFRTYLPLTTRWIRPHAHFVRVPLFPRYLFVEHDNPDLWRPIREAPGVAAVLTCANRMQYARAGSVEAVQAAEALAASSPRPTAQWAPGASVALARGSLAGHPAVVLSVHRDQARIAILLFGALREVQAPLGWLVERQ